MWILVFFQYNHSIAVNITFWKLQTNLKQQLAKQRTNTQIIQELGH